MNIFDVVGPIMIGPSSSHTAGVVKIGNICKKILGHTPKYVEVTFYGSFADTYIGHGTDKAIVGGLLGYPPDDKRIRTSLENAKSEGYNFKIMTKDKKTRHPNTLKIEAKGIDGKPQYILAESIGGGAIQIRKINTMDVTLTGELNTILLQYEDKPGMIYKVSKILSENNTNIATLNCYRSNKGGTAILSIEIDGIVDKDIKEKVNSIPNVYAVSFIDII